MKRIFLIAAAAGALLAGRAAAQEPWRALVGCYRMDDWRFALDSVPFVGVFADEENARTARSSSSYDDRLEKMWRMPAPDSVRLRIEHGLYGYTYHFAVRGDALVGLMTSTTDIVLPHPPRPQRVRAVREPCPPDSAFSNPPPDSAALAALYGYSALRPTRAQIAADPRGAVVPLRAWLAAHPEARARWDISYNARTLFEHAATLDVQASALELTGTYRLEVARTGGPTHVFYGRTEVRPWLAERHDTMAWRVERPTGYRLRFALTRDSASLPVPGPAPGRRYAHGRRADNSEIDVRLPGADSADGARRFRGAVLLVNFAGAFYGRDRELVEWDHEWFRQNQHDDMLSAAGEFVLWPDGRVTFAQREELAPDRVVTLRGERISRAVWECTGDECW